MGEVHGGVAPISSNHARRLTQAGGVASYDPFVRSDLAFTMGLGQLVSAAVLSPLGQVIEGETEVVNIRDADGRLGPLIFALVALGILTIIATVMFWRLTRPHQLTE